MLKVLSIIGYTRSGSTLLDSILGQLDGFCSTGELHYLWQRGISERRRCGCGEPLTACPVWSKVLERMVEDGALNPEQVSQWQDRTVRSRHTLGLLRGGTGAMIDQAALGRYRDVAERLYRSIAAVTGARVIVDSSKRPSDGVLTTLLPQVEPYFVQLVRDPRAVVYSWRRTKRELDTDTPTQMPRQRPLVTAAGWLELNALSELVRQRTPRGRSMILRYEDLTADPQRAIEAIRTMLGETNGVLPFLDGHSLRMKPTHTVSGNPNRFATGVVELRPDDEWMRAMRGSDRLITTFVSSPLLARYRYPLWPGRDGAVRQS